MGRPFQVYREDRAAPRLPSILPMTRHAAASVSSFLAVAVWTLLCGLAFVVAVARSIADRVRP